MLHGLIRRQEALNLSEVALFDDDPARLATMGAFARAFGEWQGARFTISHSDDLAEAASDARFIFSAIRVGQERGRILDERVPLTSRRPGSGNDRARWFRHGVTDDPGLASLRPDARGGRPGGVARQLHQPRRAHHPGVARPYQPPGGWDL